MYGKLFASAFTGSLYGAGLNVHAVWGYAIANADRRGYVELNAKMLAATLGGTYEEIATAIKKLISPDPESRTKAEEGKRMLREGQFIYRIVNYETYRSMRDEDARRESQRKKTRDKRSGSLHLVSRCLPLSAHAEAEAEGEVRREDSSELAPEGDSEPAILVFPTASRGIRPREWGLRESLVREFQAAYPAVDILAEARKALAWIVSNPSKKKTFHGMPSFLNRWMGKVQDRGGSGGGGNGPPGSGDAEAAVARLAGRR